MIQTEKMSADTLAELFQPRRKITGMSAILLPFSSDGAIDWDGFAAHVQRTHAAGLAPAVNMDTGYGNLIDDAIRRQALQLTRELIGDGKFVAGAFVGDAPGSAFNLDAYRQQIDLINEYAGTPVIFQSYGLTRQSDAAIADAYRQIGECAGEFIGFELGTMFAPFGKIYSLELYAELMGIAECTGAKHSSLSRELEWERLILRNRTRPDFRVFTGNDLAIDMVMYGSDYLLGLSTFAPEEFAMRDAYWEAGDPRFYELNDLLQYLGFFAFRDPVPAYKHSAAQFLFDRGWIKSSLTHPNSPKRPDSDEPILHDILVRLEKLTG
ncbi:dihydrodipicolinate synthase family protein [Blastopirellula retiformator]|uniref:dihydrodipicolinate synthase family protein n=1 Tax=Blastopirellula retiformator TaxID=2527970 RepID=UPI001FEA519E|nr:dihydrodipicolinate synthase family protein [Blastopirellula retiformator]